ncbi:MAG: DoxX family membrane protein [Longimicrobiaceae bacterium]
MSAPARRAVAYGGARSRRGYGLYAIAALFLAAGVLHFVIPGSYEAIVPPFLPARRFLVYLSGACELAGGIGVLVPRTRRAAALGLVALLAAVFPANVQMLVDAVAAGKPGWQLALFTLRLPLQFVLMWCIWRTAGREGAGSP